MVTNKLSTSSTFWESQKAIALQLPKLRSNVLRLLVKANSSDLSHLPSALNITVEALDVNKPSIDPFSALFLEALSTMIKRAWRWQKLPSLSRHLS